MPDDTLTIQCPAKVNLALSVGAPRAKDGLHPISSWMLAIDLADMLTLTRRAGDTSTFHRHVANDTPTEITIDWPVEKDLAFRAHALMQSHAGRALPVQAELSKRIPSGAGLGGGSADAAGIFVGLNRLFTLGLTDADLLRLGMQLGSDVGFMVAAQCGTRSAVVGGVGERIDVAPMHEPLHMTLVLSAYQCATAEVYRRFDTLRPDAAVDEQRVCELTRMRPLAAESLFNDLADAAVEVEPELKGLRLELGESTGLPVHVSGSGSALFLLTTSPEESASLARWIVSEHGVAAVAAVTT